MASTRRIVENRPGPFFMVMTATDTTVFGLLAFFAVLMALMAWWGIRLARRAERENAAATVHDVRAAAARHISGRDFAYVLLQGRLSAGTFTLNVHDANGALMTQATTHAVPMQGVLQTFTLDGRRYQCSTEGIMGRRVILREADTQQVVMSALHESLRVQFFRERSDDLLFEVKVGTVFAEYSTVLQQAQEIGRLVDANLAASRVRVLTLSGAELSRLERCFLLCRMPGGG
ncbi:hypothetical protein GEMMAAP_00485 [Gemmatimonas phototrophica]|uniref:Uncharacterized protein n=2 Tax=Gemmatimonas phototrophica TaxID=1379270 RepID=A0A143BGJ5_9BACT|nr:hypothetical protein GEMMAAP_00485 [Gemmatimonas phototrophica]